MVQMSLLGRMKSVPQLFTKVKMRSSGKITWSCVYILSGEAKAFGPNRN